MSDIPVNNFNRIKDIILQELFTYDLQSAICYRDGKRYAPYMAKLFSEEASRVDVPGTFDFVDPNKVIVITGGTGGIGSKLSLYLAAKGARKFVLMGVHKLPPRDQWKSIIKNANGIISVESAFLHRSDDELFRLKL